MLFITTHFTNFQFSSFLTATILGIISIVLFARNKYNASLAFLFLSALILRLTMAAIDPFLNLWDEQFHALVAKNMLDYPFKPMLVANPVLPFDMSNWSGSHIWLHKQPLFLWQIAVSYKIFGITEFAVRFPSAIMTSLCVLMIFRIGRNFVNERIAFCAAFLFTFSNYQLEMVSGSINTDHNDIAFMFYVTASIWSWSEYLIDKKLRWILLIGIFSGLAILVKWLPGLIVFSGWSLAVFLNRTERKKIKNYKDILISFAVAIIIMLPWQIYKSYAFPQESRIEYEGYSRHITEPLDHHSGDMWFHFDLMGVQYGKAAVFLIIPALFLLSKSIRLREAKIGILTFICAFYIFFSMVPTKMPLFCIPVAPLLFLAFGTLLEKLIGLKFIPPKYLKVFGIAVLLATGFIYLDIKTLELKHSNHDPNANTYRPIQVHNAEIGKKAARSLPSKDYIVFNCYSFNNILIMFYTGNTAYSWYPDKETFNNLKNRGLKIATFTDEHLPDYLASDNSVFKMDMRFIAY